MSVYHLGVLYQVYMDAKKAMIIQCEALRDLVLEEDWHVDAEVMLDVGSDFRRTINTFP